MKNYVQPGNTVSFTATADVVSGAVVIVGALVGIACGDVANGAQGEMQVCGVFELPKTSANTPAQFAKAYWNAGAGEVTTTASGNTLIGVFMDALAGGTDVASVRLNGVSV